MWVADMSFGTCPEILTAFRARFNYPIFGYFSLPDRYYQSIIGWHMNRHGGIAQDDIGYENGILGGISNALNCFAAPGNPVLVHTSTYPGFTRCINANGYRLVDSELVQDSKSITRMNHAEMDKLLDEQRIHVVLLCSPHNPTGRVWEHEELEEAMALFARHGCIVLSDEIWSDVILGKHKHIPIQSVSDEARKRTISFYSSSKTFITAQSLSNEQNDRCPGA